MITVTDVKCFITAPRKVDLVVVKVETSEPGLYGLGCATFTQRAKAVKTAVDEYLRPIMIGRDVTKIEDAWQVMMGSSYWRNGPVLNNAISGVDEALWDIKGKIANLPVYELIGGKVREGVRVLPFGTMGLREGMGMGSTLEEIGDTVELMLKHGWDCIRVMYSSNGRGKVAADRKPEGAPEGFYLDPRQAIDDSVALFSYLRDRFGYGPQFAMDVHEQFSPTEAGMLIKALEPYKPFFLEDCLSPENLEWFRNIRQSSSVPMAMGELFVHPMEYKPLITERLIDYIRVHISFIGGLTPARKLAALCEAYGVKTIWHGPADLSPVGAAAQIHLDLVSPNCAMQEFGNPTENEKQVFPGSFEARNGYVYANGKPGLGVDFDEKAAAAFPPVGYNNPGFMARIVDGTAVRS